jgi:hypothetical protein
MHGDRTHEAIQEQLKHKLPAPVDPALPTDGAAVAANADPGALKPHALGPDGKHRLHEGRKQHDEADRDSEKNRLAREHRPASLGNK